MDRFLRNRYTIWAVQIISILVILVYAWIILERKIFIIAVATTVLAATFYIEETS
jgi:hypothetical protein